MGPSSQPQIQPGVVVTHAKGRWSSREDSLLMSKVLDEGARDWVEVSSFVGSRSAKQCRERWHQVLDPQLNHDPITRYEGDFILKWVARKGQQWAKIARQLKGRSDNAVKNWYNGVQKKSKRRESALELQRQNASQREDSSSPVPDSDWHFTRLLSPCGSDRGKSGESVNYTTSPAAERPRSPVIPHSQKPPRQGQCVWYKGGVPIDRSTEAATTHGGGAKESSEFAAEGP
ncbi:hypothetical protein E4U59_002293 [Claviceps monticola]|nr:hypothetical protein E4U59_002293 [Claviceps monticola]